MISLLLHESEEKPRTSVDNKDIMRMYLGYIIINPTTRRISLLVATQGQGVNYKDTYPTSAGGI